MPPAKDIPAGRKFGRLTVLSEAPAVIRANGHRRRMWRCRCSCGNRCTVSQGHLVTGHTSSCGCLWFDRTSESHTIHGFTKNGAKPAEFTIWCAMRHRCENKNMSCYERYGARGIRVCARWQEFQPFFDDMGPRPSKKHSIERINNDGNYEPSNCRWALPREQGRNTRRNRWIEANGRRMIVSDWARHMDCNSKVLWHRLSRGWNPADAVTVPVGPIGTNRRLQVTA